MARVAHLFRASKKRLLMEQLEFATLIANYGIEGCAHARPGGGKRQVLLVDLETLDAMDLAPGVIRENITTAGINVNGLELGQRLRIGPAVLEVSAVCTPCDQLEKVRPGLRRELYGRRGMLCRVVEGGVIRQGDSIERVPSSLTAPLPAISSADAS